jgi:uncharacterized membrane protein
MSFEHILAVIGAILPVASAIASALNQQVRKSEAPTPAALKAQVIVNTLAMNLDKVKLAAAALKALKK